jgi:hypothetical protein
MGDIDIDRIIQEYQDRQNAGEPEPFDSFLPTPPPPAGPAPQEDDPLLPPGYSYTAPTDKLIQRLCHLDQEQDMLTAQMEKE